VRPRMSTTRILFPSPFIFANSTIALIVSCPCPFGLYMAEMRENYQWVRHWLDGWALNSTRSSGRSDPGDDRSSRPP
jgi:hypothetical protein